MTDHVADFAQALYEEMRSHGSILTRERASSIADRLSWRYNIGLKPIVVEDPDEAELGASGGGAAMRRRRFRELLPLARPLAGVDTETTGPDPENDRIVDFAIVKQYPDGTRESRTWRINPGCPIPPDATKVHGLTDADVADCPRFAEVASEIDDAMRDCDLLTFNGRRFDIPLLKMEFERAGVAWSFVGENIDAFSIYRTHAGHSLSNAVEFYLGRKHTNAHGAEADASVTIDVLFAQIARYGLPGTVSGLAKIGGRDASWASEDGKIRWDANGDAVFNFGKEKGRRLVDAKSFARWVLGRDFATDVKDLCTRAVRGEQVRKPEEVSANVETLEK